MKKLTFYTKIKAWFTAKGFKMPKWTAVKALFAESSVGKLLTKIKAFFKGSVGGTKIPAIKSLFMKSPIGVIITTIKDMFKTKVPGGGIIDKVKTAFTKLFAKGGMFGIFRELGNCLLYTSDAADE